MTKSRTLEIKKIKNTIYYADGSFWFKNKEIPIYHENPILERNEVEFKNIYFNDDLFITDEGRNIQQFPYHCNDIYRSYLSNFGAGSMVLPSLNPIYELYYDDLRFPIASFNVKYECPINKQIAEALNFHNNQITVVINQNDKKYDFYYYIPLTFIDRWGNLHKNPESWIASRTLDFKNDNLFLKSISIMFLPFRIVKTIEEIKNDPIEAINYLKLLKY